MRCDKVQQILDDYVFARRDARGLTDAAGDQGLDGGAGRPGRQAVGLRSGEKTSAPSPRPGPVFSRVPRGPAWSAGMPEGLSGSVRHHLARCERCRKAMHEMLALAAEFERMDPSTGGLLAPDVDDLTGRVMAAIRAGMAARPAAVVCSTAGTATEAAPVHVKAVRRERSLVRDILILAGLAGAALPTTLATTIAVVGWLLDARAALETPLLRTVRLLLRPAAIALRTLGDVAFECVVGIARVWSLASSALLDLGAAPILILAAFTLAMGLLLAALLARSGLDEASQSG